MNRPDIEKPVPTGDPSSAEVPQQDRRRALLTGLSKGGTILAAAAPVSSFAAGRVKTADGRQCTLSGQMSAVMSQNATMNPCAAFHPTYFFEAETLIIADQPEPLKTALLGMALGSYISRLAAEYFKFSATEARKLTPLNRPLGSSNGVLNNSATLKVSDILSGAGSARVLRQLHARPNSDETIFIAAYFSALLSAPSGSFEKVPFPASDVQAQWTGTNRSNAAALYRSICTEGAVLSRLG